jgi:hypothetical protein
MKREICNIDTPIGTYSPFHRFSIQLQLEWNLNE